MRTSRPTRCGKKFWAPGREPPSVAIMKARLICLVRRHQWRHLTVWTCNRCGKTRANSAEMGDPFLIGGPDGGGGL
jgi:hypothetical protein